MIKITKIYSDDSGESHFEDIEMPLQNNGALVFSLIKPPLKILFLER